MEECPVEANYWCVCRRKEKSIWCLPINCKRKSRHEPSKILVCYVYSRSGLISVPAEQMLLNTRSVRLGYHYLETVKNVYLRAWSEPRDLTKGQDVRQWCCYDRYPRFCVQLTGGYGYYSLPNVGLHWVRVLQRWLRRVRKQRQERRLAMAMAWHPRLGQESLLSALDPDLVQKHILGLC